MKPTKITIRVKQKAPRTLIAQRPRTQEISRQKYKRDKTWKRNAGYDA